MQRLRAELPSYMVPAVMITLDEIPLGPTGKFDIFVGLPMSLNAFLI